MGYFDYKRRPTSTVHIGESCLGSDYPIRLQSMTNTSSMDTVGSVAQCERIIDAGADYVRLTAQGVREAENIGAIRRALRDSGRTAPLVADIHFNPKAAFEAAVQVEKVRINPGNFVDPGRTFRKLEYTDEEYAAEIRKIEDALVPFLDLCREHGTAIRIGVNHGSLSDRIMSRYGDTPAGMVESAMEFLRVCMAHRFTDVVISIKASNVVVMVETVRRLVRAMDAEDMHFPLHLGVTEAGDGEDGRVKSAVGIGTLLSEGIGDTIRVSLSEDPELEVPVAAMLVKHMESKLGAAPIEGEPAAGYDNVMPQRYRSIPVGNIGSDNQPVVVTEADGSIYPADAAPDMFVKDIPDMVEIDASADADAIDVAPGQVIVLSSCHANYTGEMQAMLHAMRSRDISNPVILKAHYASETPEEVTVKASADLGALLLNGFGDGIWLEADSIDSAAAVRLSFGILQATRLRITRTEYIACPGCGRTLFDLQSTLRSVKEATSHLKGLKIGVMGCIVNGPGEMADADFGYVGAGAGKVSLYKGKECVEKNIPAGEALPRLIELIKKEGRWK